MAVYRVDARGVTVAAPFQADRASLGRQNRPRRGGLPTEFDDETLEPKDGKWTGSLQFLVVVGKTEQLTTVPLTFSEAMFHKIQRDGLVLGARVKTPPGTTGFSLGFRDMPSGLVGTLHVPL